jgi:hypothetical protein
LTKTGLKLEQFLSQFCTFNFKHHFFIRIRLKVVIFCAKQTYLECQFSNDTNITGVYDLNSRRILAPKFSGRDPVFSLNFPEV